MNEPFLFTHRDEFFALPPEERPPHIWECLQYLEWRRSELPLAPLPGARREGEVGEPGEPGGGLRSCPEIGPGGEGSPSSSLDPHPSTFEESEIDRNVVLVRHIAMDVCKAIADKLGAEGAHKNRFDPRWPRYHPNSKKPEYLTGCFPPLLLCMMEDEATWKEQSAEALAENGRELAEWAATPAGRHGIAPADIASAKEKVDALAKATEAAYQAKKALDEADARLDEAKKRLREAGG